MKNKILKLALALSVAVVLVAAVTLIMPNDSNAGTTVTLPTVPVCNHNYIEKADAKYLKEARNFEHGDIYYKSCSKCGAKTTQKTFEVGDPYIYGDADDDGFVDDVDMLLLIQYVANLDDTTGTSTIEVKPGADANGDGVIDDVDMLLLIQYVANLDDATGTSTIVLGPKED